MRWIVLAGLLTAAAVGCDAPAAKVATAPEKRAEAPKAKPAPRKPVEQLAAELPPVPPRPLTYKEALAEARKIGARLDAEEPELTRKALAILTVDEKADAEFEMLSAKNSFNYSPPALIRLGLRAWVERESRRRAAVDPEYDAVMSVIWEPESGPDGLLRAMHVWGEIRDRIEVAEAVQTATPTARLDPKTRDAILALGGRKWLSR